MSLKYRLGTCSICHSENIYIVKRMPSGEYCWACNQLRLNAGKEPENLLYKPKPIKSKYVYKRKASGELVLFTDIWESLAVKKCEVCSCQVEFAPHTFSHILSKGSHPAFKLFKENISIMCFDCHYKWDNVAKSELIGEGWIFIKTRAENLKNLYNTKTKWKKSGKK